MYLKNTKQCTFYWLMCIWIVGGRVPVTVMLAGMNLSKPGMNLSKPGMNLSKPGKKHHNHVIILNHALTLMVIKNCDVGHGWVITSQRKCFDGITYACHNHCLSNKPYFTAHFTSLPFPICAPQPGTEKTLLLPREAWHINIKAQDIYLEAFRPSSRFTNR